MPEMLIPLRKIAIFLLLKSMAISLEGCFYVIIRHDKNWPNLELDCLLLD